MIRSTLRRDFSPPGSNEETVNSPDSNNPLTSPENCLPSPTDYTIVKHASEDLRFKSEQHITHSTFRHNAQRETLKRAYLPSQTESYSQKTKTSLDSVDTKYDSLQMNLSSSSSLNTVNKTFSVRSTETNSDASSSKINTVSSKLYFCSICADKAQSEHYGGRVCESCRGFFKRAIKNQKRYLCSKKKDCVINKKNRNHCQYCRLEKCYKVGLSKKAAEEEIFEDKKRKADKKKESAAKCQATDENPLVIDMNTINSAELFVDPKIAEFANVEFDPIRQLCLAADKQLASLAEWAKRIPYFIDLELNDQVKLLQWNWPELLIGGFCYRSSAVSNGILLSTGLHLSRENLEKAGVGTLITKLFSEVINKMRVLQIDVSEWGCLRAIMLFAPDTKELRDTEKVENIRERYIATLCTYVQKTYPNDEQRLGNLLLRLGPLKSIALQVLEHLFFFKILGDIPIDTFLLEMLDSDNH